MSGPAVFTLANGVRVLMIELPQLSSLTAAVFVDTGSRDELEAEAGISHFLEHMLFKGTRRRSGHELCLAAERLGAELNAYTAKDRTGYHISGLARHQQHFIDLLGDMVCNSVFPDDELERERGVILQEIRRSQDRPAARARQLLDAVAFPTHPYGRPVLGTVDSVRRLERADLCRYHSARYRGCNVIVALAGAVDVAAACAQIERVFAGLPSGKPRPRPLLSQCGGIAAQPADFAQAHLRLGFPIANLREDYYPDLVAASLLGDGLSAPLCRRIREERGLAYDVGCHPLLRDDVGQLFITAATSPDQVGEVLQAIRAVLREQAEQVSPADLERARNGLAVGLALGAERPLEWATDAAEDLFVHGRVQPLAEQLERIEAVTAEQVRDSIAGLLQKAPAVAAVGEGLERDRLAAELSPL